jgi:long-chain acyl-CoA synthetase
MEATSAQAGPAPQVEASTIAEAFRQTVARVPDRVAVRTKGGATELTWAQLRDRVDAVASGLSQLGLGRGDTIAWLLGNRPEFHILDLAATTLGATPFSIYTTASPEQIEYVMSDSEAKLAVIEARHVDDFQKARANLPAFERLIVLDGDAPDGDMTFEQLEGSADPAFDAEPHWSAVEPQDLLTLIYTSGTTGPPKGVMLSHHNLMFAVSGIKDLVEFPDGARVISWLPSAHIAERAAHHYLPVVYGMTVTDCDNPREIIGFLPEVRPNWFFAVPRIWEKLKAGLETMMAAQPQELQAQATAALEAALEKVRHEQRGEEVPEELAAKVAAADEQMFAALREQLGLDEVTVINVGAAPTPVPVLEFFHAIGLPLAELWGMSETCGSGAVNPPHRVKIGTVGPAAPGVELKLADDGEVLIRSDVVMVGYRNMPEKTRETIDEEGWLHTGDIGEFDDDRYLRIVDRKKELIINAAGKNMSPANIESELKAASPLIGNAACIGDARPYNTALIVLDADFAPAWAAQHGIEDTSLASLAKEEPVRAAVQEGIDAANAKLARVEQIKKFHIVEGDWLPGGDELTPTMKLKRKPIDEKYRDAIEAMYAGH